MDYITHYVKWALCGLLLVPALSIASCGQVARIEVRIDDGRPDNTYYIFPSQRYCGVDPSILSIVTYDGSIQLNTVIDTIKTNGVSITGDISLQGTTRTYQRDFTVQLGKKNKETIFIHHIPVTFHFEKIVNMNE